MLSAAFERRAIVQPNGDLDEYLAFVLRNSGQVAAILPDNWLVIPVTDSPAQFVAARDSHNPAFEYDHGVHDGRFKFAGRLHGVVEPGAERTIGIHLLRHDAAEVTEDGLSLADPIRGDGFPGLEVTSVSSAVTVVFPGHPYQRALRAPRAVFSTSRTATWEFALSEGAFRKVHAVSERLFLPRVLRSFDDDIAELHVIVGRVACGETVDIAGYLSRLSQEAKVALRSTSVPDAEAPPGQCRAFLLTLLRGLEAHRSFVEEMARAFRVPLDAAESVERLHHSARQQHGAARVPAPVPDGLADALLSVVRFAHNRRAMSGHAWSKRPNEQELHDKMHEFVLASDPSSGREAWSGNGRADLVVFGTPVELKAAALGAAPRLEAAAVYEQQAAEYASRRGLGVGILVVLDTTDRTSEKRHSPHLAEEVGVSVVAPRDSGSGTVVITVVLAAHPPRPSDLRDPRRPMTTSSRNGN